MPSHHLTRRSFIAGIGGAFGLNILLRDMEAAAEGQGPPPRFLMMHWPVGTIRDQFIPDGQGAEYRTAKGAQGPGYIISPFDTPELRPHAIILHGFNMDGIRGQGGGHEDGTPFVTTGSSSPGTRYNGGETDDGCAGGPSWDQIFLRRVPELSRRNHDGTIIGRGYYNTICDARVDSHETSTRCLSYGYEKQRIESYRPGGTIEENRPLLPQLSPLTAFRDLFGGFVPGGVISDEETLVLLRLRKSVLDYSLRELERLKTLAPGSERHLLDAHGEVVRKLEAQLSDQLTGGAMNVECALPPLPDPSAEGQTGEMNVDDYGQPETTRSDEGTHEAVGKSHAAILRAAFACDLIRVATFQWSPGTNHVSFSGLDPNSPNTIWMHHPLSHRIGDPSFYNGPRPAADAYVWDAMVNANRWYFRKTAEIVDEFRRQVDPLDPMGASLLDRTVIPLVTEVAEPAHTREGHAALVFGGGKLGLRGGQYQNVSGTHNQLWVSLAQAFLGRDAESRLSNEAYVKSGAHPIPGLWEAPS